MVLIGSKAIKHWFPDFKREPVDTDYATNESLAPEKNPRVEYMGIPPLNKRYLMHDIASPDHLYTLKLSHVFWPIKQEKTLSDIAFLKSKGCKKDEALFKELYEHWNNVHGENKRVDYDRPNETFFDDAVDRPIEHDTLHVMMNPEPLYVLIKPEHDDANISEKMFYSLPFEIQLELCREEAYVLALERFVVPGVNINWRIAYGKMLRAMVLRLSPLWFGTYVAENYDKLQKPSYNYEKRFKEHPIYLDYVKQK